VYRFARSRKLPPKTLQIMKGKLPDQKQTSLFEPNLHQIVNPAHELVLLAEKIEWEYFDREFSSHYSHTGKPSVPVRVTSESQLGQTSHQNHCRAHGSGNKPKVIRR